MLTTKRQAAIMSRCLSTSGRRIMRDYIRHYMESAERLESIIPTVDPANGDMIIVYKMEDRNGGRSLRMSPELGAEFRSYFSGMIRQKAN